jgi:hypothetical protein
MRGTPEERISPLRRQLPLWIGFALVVVAAVFTVLLPELAPPAPEADAAVDTAPVAETP